LDRILLETDSPFLTPRNIQPRPKYNEPKHLHAVVKKVAGLMRISPQTLIDQSNLNRQKLFGF
jgi:TatD DNase family protein